jgi:hypothetical protein
MRNLKTSNDAGILVTLGPIQEVREPSLSTKPELWDFLYSFEEVGKSRNLKNSV